MKQLIKKSYKFMSVIGSILTLFSCSTGPKYTNIVEQVSIPEFMGAWYVQAGRFTPFEKDVYNGLEKYTWNQEKERVDIDFTYNQGSLEGPLKSIPQKGWIYNTKTKSHWKVTPFWPLKFDFLVIGLAKDYSWTVIGVPDQKYVWIMTRKRNVDKIEVENIIAQIKSKNYNMDNLIFVEHRKN